VGSYCWRTGLAGQTRNSITEVQQLEKELDLVRSNGFARDNEELEMGVRCIAAAIRDDAGNLVAGLSISAPADRANDGWVEALRQTALEISNSLGHGAERMRG
jgi:DNA-binding IclR family transcriptional regulator